MCVVEVAILFTKQLDLAEVFDNLEHRVWSNVSALRLWLVISRLIFQLGVILYHQTMLRQRWKQ